MGHHQEGGKWYVDTAFINGVSSAVPGSSLEHLGFGEFYLLTPKGQIDFDRGRGKKFPGQSGRSHWMTDDKGGKLVEEAIKLVEGRGKSERMASRLLHIANQLPKGDETRRELLAALQRESRLPISQFDIDEIAEMTDMNDHNGAVLHLADMLGDRKTRDVMDLLAKIHKKMGHMPHSLIEFRGQLRNELLELAKKKLDRDLYEKLHGAF